MNERLVTAAIIACLALSLQALHAQVPAYVRGQGPLILLDAAHYNAWNDQGRDSMTRFLEDMGFRVRQLDEPINLDVLGDVKILLIGGALSAKNAVPTNLTQEEFDRAWRLPVPSAFSEVEIRLLTQWVESGGALLLVFDHMPIAGAIGDLAQAFGIEVSNGFAVDESSLADFTQESVANAGAIVFRRSDETLMEHSVTDGRSSAEAVETVATFVGSAFRLPQGGESLLVLQPTFISLLPEVAWQFSEDTSRMPIAAWSQGGVLRVGRGRVAIFGEMGILATPDAIALDPDPDNPQKQNPQLLLNVLYWLSGVID